MTVTLVSFIIMVDVIIVTIIKHRRVIGVGYSACGRATLTDLPLFFSSSRE